MPILRAKRIASSFGTGSTPGWARQIGQVWTFGSSPKESSQPQNIFVRVASWTWISRPITASSSAMGSSLPAQPRQAGLPGVREPERALERVGGIQQLLLAEGRSGDLEADRQPRCAGVGTLRRGEPGGDRDRRDPGEA